MKFSDIMLLEFSPPALTITAAVILVIATPLVLKTAVSDSNGSVMGDISVACTSPSDCRNYFKNCNYTCSKTQCIPYKPSATLKPYPDCSKDVSSPTPSPSQDSAWVPILQPSGSPLPSGSTPPLLKQSPVVTLLPSSSVVPEKICETKCLYSQKNPFGEGQDAVFAVDCLGKETYCGIQGNTEEDLCLIDVNGARCKDNVKAPEDNSWLKWPFVVFLQKIINVINNTGKQFFTIISDTLRSLFIRS